MKEHVYLDASVIQHLVDAPSEHPIVAGRQRITRHWWDCRKPEFELFALRQGVEQFGVTPLSITPAVRRFAKALSGGAAIPLDSALEIAVATVHNCQYLLTWDFRYIGNALKRRRLKTIAKPARFELPTICTPEQLMGDLESGSDEILEEVRAARESLAHIWLRSGTL